MTKQDVPFCYAEEGCSWMTPHQIGSVSLADIASTRHWLITYQLQIGTLFSSGNNDTGMTSKPLFQVEPYSPSSSSSLNANADAIIHHTLAGTAQRDGMELCGSPMARHGSSFPQSVGLLGDWLGSELFQTLETDLLV